MPSFTKCLALSALVAGAAALPTGAPKCQINPAVIGEAHMTPSPDAGYTLSASSATWTAGQKITVTVTGTTHDVVGVLMYATPDAADDAALAPKGSKSHLGVFNVPNGFRAQTADICTGAGVQQQALESTITHANPTPKGKSVTFEWTAPTSGSGAITFNAAVASGAPGNPWMVVPIVTLQSAGGSAPTPAGPGSPPPSGSTMVTFTAGGIETQAPTTGGGSTGSNGSNGGYPSQGGSGGSGKKCKYGKKGKKHGKKHGGEMMTESGAMPMPMPSATVAVEQAPATAAPEATAAPAYPAPTDAAPAYPSAAAPMPTDSAPAYPAPAYPMPEAPAAGSTDMPMVPAATNTASPDTTVLSGSSPAFNGKAAWITLAGAAAASGFFILA
ncbi:hypothetical protein HDU90_001413 [Geranomyces variabilis]|nr:hypothetical protein HDU90_001413 [Geranomyces variabilis]